MSVLEKFIEVCRAHDGDESNPVLRQMTGEFMDAAEKDPSIAERAASALSELPPFGAAWRAVILGSNMERNGGVDTTGPAVVSLMRAWLPRLGSDDPSFLKAFPMLCQSTVAHLARMPSYRSELARDSDLMTQLDHAEELSYGAAWVREALLKQSGPLIVLHPESGHGLRLQYVNVWNCFHLFSLIQTAIGTRLPGGKIPDPDVVAAARHTFDRGVKVNDEAWWHFGDPRSPVSNIAASIWGEGHVNSIPKIDGVQTVLLWPKILGARCWDSGFFGACLEAMPPDASVDGALTESECRAWLERLGIAARDQKPPAIIGDGIPSEARRKWWWFK